MNPGRSRARKPSESWIKKARTVLTMKTGSKYKTLLTSISVTVGAMIMLAAATFAWFSAEALTGASSVVTGFMDPEIMMTIDDVRGVMFKQGIGKEEGVTDPEEYTDEQIAAYLAERDIYVQDAYMRPQTVLPATPVLSSARVYAQVPYIIITDKKMQIVTLDGIEPGQMYPVHLTVGNMGELAFTYSPHFAIPNRSELGVTGDDADKPASYTGLEKLDKEAAGGKYGQTDTPEGEDYYKNNPEWKMKNRVLSTDQRRIDESEYLNRPGTSTSRVSYEGGYLEDVLKVYIVPEDKVGHEREVVTDDDETNPYYVGTIADIIGKNGEEGTARSRRTAFTGYTLPKSEVTEGTGADTHIQCKNVTIEYPDEGREEVRENVSEIGEMYFLIVAPEDMDNRYQYASVSLSLGVYATQVEYETDGTGCMIYDRGAHSELRKVTFECYYSASDETCVPVTDGTRQVLKGGKAAKPSGFTAKDGDAVLPDGPASFYKDRDLTVEWNFEEDTITEDTTIYVRVVPPGSK